MNWLRSKGDGKKKWIEVLFCSPGFDFQLCKTPGVILPLGPKRLSSVGQRLLIG
jgi:hypothetical protein